MYRVASGHLISLALIRWNIYGNRAIILVIGALQNKGVMGYKYISRRVGDRSRRMDFGRAAPYQKSRITLLFVDRRVKKENREKEIVSGNGVSKILKILSRETRFLPCPIARPFMRL